MNDTQTLIGRRVYRIGNTGFTYDISTDEKVMTSGPTDYHTIKGVLGDGRVIAENHLGRLVVLLIGDDWKVEKQEEPPMD